MGTIKKINIEGIPFSENLLKELKDWLMDDPDKEWLSITADIRALDKVQSFLMTNSENFSCPDSLTLELLTGLQCIKNRLNLFLDELN